MKLFASFSEAIREGAKLTPEQCFGKLYDQKATCAMGAAIHAMSERPLDQQDIRETYLAIVAADPSLRYLTTKTTPPCGCAKPLGGRGCHTNDLQNLIIHLNNTHHWTREAIADWLEREEEALGFVTVIESAEPREVVHAASV